MHTETVMYPCGCSATGTAPIPRQCPDHAAQPPETATDTPEKEKGTAQPETLAGRFLDALLDDISGPLVDESVEHFDVIGAMLRRPDVMQFIGKRLAALSAAPDTPETPEPEWTALDGSLTIRFLQYINAKRAVRWHEKGGIKSWSALEWAGAMAGEAGEACNAAKKLKRIEDNIANINLEEGRSLTDEQNASSQVVDEIADTVIYGVLLAERVGLDLEEAIRMKFNRKSEEYGFPERIPPNERPKSASADSSRLRELLAFIGVTNVEDAEKSVKGLRERIKFTEDYESVKFKLDAALRQEEGSGG